MAYVENDEDGTRVISPPTQQQGGTGMDPVTASLGAAGLLAAAQLVGGIFGAQSQRESQKRDQNFTREMTLQKEGYDREQNARNALNQAQQSQIGLVQNMGGHEQSALANLIGAIQRSVR
jgi:hypothetical protein